MKWVGIDFGSNLAGTTAICYEINGKLNILQSEKKASADKFLESFLLQFSGLNIFIDAPLSLPQAYYTKGEDYFYRTCDRELNAMSPMFLGGLTARAIRLRSQKVQHQFLECYPAELVRLLGLNGLYKKKHISGLEVFFQELEKHNDLALEKEIQNWHQMDALLCWMTGKRYSVNQHKTFGQPGEGLIVV